MHTLMDLRGSIPYFIRITAGNVHDVNMLDELLLQPGAFYVMDVELFFKWIKQYLRIKAFFGTSQNAVNTQIWIAISVY